MEGPDGDMVGLELEEDTPPPPPIDYLTADTREVDWLEVRGLGPGVETGMG